jgi:hypothetical protein
MQTFLPFEDFCDSAKCLDVKRLGKQRVEVLQILKALTSGSGWKHHPAVKMWEGYVPALVMYGVTICEEWLSRGYKDTCMDKIKAFAEFKCGSFCNDFPYWLGSDAFHQTHRQILLGKNYSWYNQFGWSEQPAVLVDGKWPYIWP